MRVIDWAAAGSFEWLTQVWIPAFVGLATTAVAGLAWWTSVRASKLARQLELDRVQDQAERVRAADRSRLLDMASVDARVLRRWVVEEMRPSPNFGLSTRRLDAPPPPRSEKEAAKLEAIVQLEQSLVPGAIELLWLTSFDIDERYAFRLPAGSADSPALVEHREQMRAMFDDRTRDRIRDWGLDPELQFDRVIAEYRVARMEPDTYWQIGLYANPPHLT